MTFILRDFVRMDRSKVGVDPHDFFDELHKIVHAIRVTSMKKVELASHKFKKVVQVCFTQCKTYRKIESGPI